MLAHGGSLTWDELVLIIAAYGLLLVVAATGRNQRTDAVRSTIENHLDVTNGARGEAVSILDVSHRYGPEWILSRINLTILPGQFVSILGANGAGKTTLLSILSTLATPTDGDVVVGSTSLRANPTEVRQRVGVVGHQPLLYPRLSVIENLRFFAALFSVTDDRVIEDVLRQVSMWQARHQRAGELSHGQQARVALARALLHQPQVLLLDEPYTGLDLIAAERLDGLLQQLHAAGLTVVMTSHDLNRSFHHADRLIILADGRIAHDRRKTDTSLQEIEQLYRSALASAPGTSRDRPSP